MSKEMLLKDVVETEGDFTEEELLDLEFYFTCMVGLEKLANKGLLDRRKGKKTYMVRLAAQIILDMVEKEMEEDTDYGNVFNAIISTKCQEDCDTCTKKDNHVGGIC